MASSPIISPDPVPPLAPVNVSDPHHVVIIGGGFGGIRAAKSLANKTGVRVTLIDKRNFHLFQPLLYQVATASLSPTEVTFPIRSMFKRQKNVQVILAEATGVDLDRKVVKLADGEVAYDSLIVAAGVQSSYFGHHDWADHAPGLKSIEDAEKVRDKVLGAFEAAERETTPLRRKAMLTFVIIGGGPTGVELAGAIGELAHQTLRTEFRSFDSTDSRVVLVNSGDHVLKGYPDRLAKAAEKSLERLGVEVLRNSRVTSLVPGGVVLGDTQIATDTVIWAAGVEASPLAKTLGVPLSYGNRIPVNADLTLPSHPEVSVIGDIAAVTDAHGDLLPGVAQVAMQQGTLAAKNILRRLKGEETKSFHYKDKGMLATIGRNHAVADIGPFHLSGFPAWVIWAAVHIATLIGRRNRVAVMIQWAWSYVTHGRGARIITESPSVFDRPEPEEKEQPLTSRIRRPQLPSLPSISRRGN